MLCVCVCAYWGIRCLEVTYPPFTSVCFAEVARTHRGEIPGMLSMPEQRRKGSRILVQFFSGHEAPAAAIVRPADELFFCCSPAWRS